MNARKKVVKPRVTSECRVDGHMWMPHDGGPRGRRGYFRVLKCGRGCKVFRHQELDKYGEITKQWYEYSDSGYLVKGGMPKDEKAAIRLLHINGNLGNVVAIDRKKKQA